LSQLPNAPTVKRDTAVNILDTAERLCGMHGIEAVSVRDIATEAGVSIAVIYHHYGSKSNLLLAILNSRFLEVRTEFDALIGDLETKPMPVVRDIIRAVLQPMNRWRTPEREAALQFYALALVCPLPPLREAIDSGVVGLRRVVELFRRALPRLTHEDVCWRLHFTMKISHQTSWDTTRLGILSKDDCHSDDPEESLARGIAFAEAAFLAPPLVYTSKATGRLKSKRRRRPRPPAH
jgi:AcrR family transcriptional regulator